MRVEFREIDAIREDSENARTHSDENRAAVRASLARFGQQVPLVVDKQGVVLAGNCRLEAARDLGWKQVAVVEFSGSQEQARALAIAMNRSGELASWDRDRLGEDLIILNGAGIEPIELGFTDRDLEKLWPEVKEPIEPPPTLAVEAPEIAITAPEQKTQAQYALLFENEDQERRFHKALKKLKRAYPDLGSSTERVVRACELMGER
jgi:ParB-like chromosome segregation protein Spo0J